MHLDLLARRARASAALGVAVPTVRILAVRDPLLLVDEPAPLRELPRLGALRQPRVGLEVPVEVLLLLLFALGRACEAHAALLALVRREEAPDELRVLRFQARRVAQVRVGGQGRGAVACEGGGDGGDGGGGLAEGWEGGADGEVEVCERWVDWREAGGRRLDCCGRWSADAGRCWLWNEVAKELG